MLLELAQVDQLELDALGADQLGAAAGVVLLALRERGGHHLVSAAPARRC